MHNQTYDDLKDACRKEPGCPVCTLVYKSLGRYVDSLFYESMMDPAARDRLRESYGFCFEHAWLAIDSGLADALGLAILYDDACGALARALPPGDNPKLSNKDVLKAIAAKRPCPLCRQQDETLKRLIGVLGEAFGREDFHEAFQQSGGLCLPHLQMVLPQVHKREGLAVLVEHQRKVLNGLKNELTEFIRKNDYRFRSEGFGAERDSYKRAAGVIAGKARPKRKYSMDE
jgi:hypothetical protein